MIQEHSPTIALPGDILTLIHHVVELVDLLYWVPVPTKGLKGYMILAERALLKHKNPERAGRSSQPQYTETVSDERGGMKSLPTPSNAWKMSKYSRQFDWPAKADIEMWKAYGSALMSDHGTPFLLFNL